MIAALDRLALLVWGEFRLVALRSPVGVPNVWRFGRGDSGVNSAIAFLREFRSCNSSFFFFVLTQNPDNRGFEDRENPETLFFVKFVQAQAQN